MSNTTLDVAASLAYLNSPASPANDTAGKAPLTRAQLRTQFARIRARSVAPSEQAFNDACAALLGEGEHAPAQWVRAAKAVRFSCPRCAGTGKFITMVVNGVPTGPGGACFRCKGAGTQSDTDVLRNEAFDRHAIDRAFRGHFNGLAP